MPQFFRNRCHFKRPIGRFLILGTFVLLQACTRPPDSEKEITFAFSGSIEQQKVESEIVEAFQKANPGIRVRTQAIGQRYEQKIQAMMVGNSAPDVMIVDIRRYDDWASRGVFLDVTGFVQKVDAENDLMPLPRRAFLRDGHYYCAPVNVQGVVMYCNLDALRKAGIPFSPKGWTWQEIEDMAPLLTGKNGNADAPTEYELVFPTPELLFASYGAKLFDNIEHPTKVTANNPRTAEALQFYRDFHTKGYAVPPEVGSDQGTYQLFRDGRIAFLFGNRAFTPILEGKTDFAWDVVPAPHGVPHGATTHQGTGIAIWKNTRYPEEARRFLEFYAGPEGSRIAMLAGRSVPVYRNQAFSAEFLDSRPPASIRRFAETMEGDAAVISLYGPGYTTVQRVLVNAVQSIIYRGTSIEAAMEEMQFQLRKELDLK